MDGVPHSFATSKINIFELMCCHVTTSMELIHWLQIADNERSEKTEEKKKSHATHQPPSVCTLNCIVSYKEKIKNYGHRMCWHWIQL